MANCHYNNYIFFVVASVCLLPGASSVCCMKKTSQGYSDYTRCYEQQRRNKRYLTSDVKRNGEFLQVGSSQNVCYSISKIEELEREMISELNTKGLRKNKSPTLVTLMRRRFYFVPVKRN